MKIKNFKLFEDGNSRTFQDGYDDDDDDAYLRGGLKRYYNHDGDELGYPDEEYGEELEEEEEDDEDVENLRYLIRTMFTNAGIEATVYGDGLNLTIESEVNRRDSLRYILKVFDVVKKIKKDILPEYESEFFIAYTVRTKKPILTFEFNYDDKSDKPPY